MKVRTRFIASVIKTAQSDTTRLPWARGVIRDVSVAGRRSTAAAAITRRA